MKSVRSADRLQEKERKSPVLLQIDLSLCACNQL